MPVNAYGSGREGVSVALSRSEPPLKCVVVGEFLLMPMNVLSLSVVKQR